MTGSESAVSRQPPVRLAIVGAGIAGAATAETAARRIDDVEIDVFEKSGRIGGRMAAATFGEHTVEASALGFWDRYTYLTEYLDRLDLDRTKPFVFDDLDVDVNERGPFLGVWGGTEFEATISKTLPGAISLLASYGASPIRLWRRSKGTASAFERLHDRVEANGPYAATDELLADLELRDAVDRPAREFFRDVGVSERCIDELLDPVLRTIWGHDAGMQSFVAALSVDGMVAHEGLQSVEGGNVRLVERLFDAVDASVHTETPIATIEADDGYTLATPSGPVGAFDAVVVATPLDHARISFEGIDVPDAIAREREFRTRHIALVDGQLEPGYFGLASRDELPTMIATTDDARFTSTVIAREIDERRNIYRVNANDELDDDLLDDLFSSIERVERFSWEAFPVYDPPIEQQPFRIGDRLYYANAMESVASTMETEIVSARNVVGLLEQDLTAYRR